jgi:hypothetical protein
MMIEPRMGANHERSWIADCGLGIAAQAASSFSSLETECLKLETSPHHPSSGA